jgi:hypothetical protein
MSKADVFVAWDCGKVLLVVDGAPCPETDQLLEEMRDSFVTTGIPREDVQVVWAPKRAAQGTSL